MSVKIIVIKTEPYSVKGGGSGATPSGVSDAKTTSVTHYSVKVKNDPEAAQLQGVLGAGAAQGQGQPGSIRPAACVYFRQGSCRNGATCPFSHAQTAAKPPCRFFSSGQQCRYGDRCRYEHDPAVRKQRSVRKPQTDEPEAVRKLEAEEPEAIRKQQAEEPEERPPSPPPAGAQQDAAPRGQKRARRAADIPGNQGKSRGRGGRKKHTQRGRALSVAYDSDDSEREAYEREANERMAHWGFRRSELNDLLCQGIKPWDDDAWDVLAQLRSM